MAGSPDGEFPRTFMGHPSLPEPDEGPEEVAAAAPAAAADKSVPFERGSAMEAAEMSSPGDLKTAGTLLAAASTGAPLCAVCG